MEWIVLGESKGRIQLVSKSSATGLLPKGSYLTVKSGESKFILRVDSSVQTEPYSPSPMIVDMDLSALRQDQKCQNIIHAYRVKDISSRTDGFIDYILPQSIARRSNQEEIDIAMGAVNSGLKVFIATVHAGQNQLLCDDKGKFITANLPTDMFFHQILVCGSTGSGKTVALKYLAQYFVEELKGAVLAINVKDIDFLRMDQPSKTKNPQIISEWNSLVKKPHGVYNYSIYYPANTSLNYSTGIDPKVCEPITLDVKKIEPEALTGLLQNITDTGAQNLPNIFRYWQYKMNERHETSNFTFNNFIQYFIQGAQTRVYDTLNSRKEPSTVTLHSGTIENISRNLAFASDFFDNPGAKCLDETDLLKNEKMSVINVTGNKGIIFGSILLRQLLHLIVAAKDKQQLNVPILIIIDEVHQFYNTSTAEQALGDLDTICRTGRSKEIGVIFSSQNPSDIPRGLSSVINTKFFFKSDSSSAKTVGVSISQEEMESLKKGYAVATIHEMSQLKVLKIPLAFAGVFEKEEKDGR